VNTTKDFWKEKKWSSATTTTATTDMEREMRNGWFRFGQQWRQFDRKRSKKNKTRAFAFEFFLVCSSCAFLFILEHYKQANTKGHTKREENMAND
jgi:hypothetical protein